MSTLQADSCPLVSIIVITYNSSKYVLETLESAKAQTYQYIELIVSDDCSTDNTVEICRQWIEKNKERFVRAEIITVIENTGIPANCNRGVKASKGEWLKLIAGDDLLYPKIIDEYNNILGTLNNQTFICSNYDLINENSEIIGNIDLSKTNYFNKCKTPNQQFRISLRISGTVPPLTAFYSREMYNHVSGFDEDYKLLEDYPFFLKLNKMGYYAFLLNKSLASYRKTSSSVTSKDRVLGKIFHPIFLHTYQYQASYCKKYVTFWERIGFMYNYRVHKLIHKLNLNKSKYNSMYYILTHINPYIIKKNIFGCKNKDFYRN